MQMETDPERMQNTVSDKTGIAVDDRVMKYMILYHLFGLLWTVQFILAMGFLTLAGAVSKWYYTMEKSKDTKGEGLREAYKRTWKYHAGSALFGSFILAVVQMIRIVFNYIMKKMSKHKENKVIKMVWYCVDCCL